MTDKTPPLKDVLAGLSEEQLKIMKEAIEAGKKGFKYDTKTGQRDFGFNGKAVVSAVDKAVSRVKESLKRTNG